MEKLVGNADLVTVESQALKVAFNIVKTIMGEIFIFIDFLSSLKAID